MVHQQDSTDPTGVSIVNGTKDRVAVRKARETKADASIALRLAGAQWGEIAQALGYPTPRAALVATEKALQRQLATESDRDAMRRLAGARLERLLRALWAKAIDDHHPEQMTAAARCRELIVDHAKLFGLPAPTEIIVTSPTTSQIEEWVARVSRMTTPNVDEYDIIDGDILEEDEPRAIQA